jgi:Ca-activated chloride channel family protein
MFKKKFSYLVLFFVFFHLNNGNIQAQIKFTKTSYDMGIITGSPNDYIDIPLKNTSKEKIFIFRTEADKKIIIHYSNKTILPDSTVFIRIAYNPDKKGIFNDNIQVHFSCFTTPYQLSIEGIAAELPKTSSAFDCPSFDRQKPNSIPESEFVIKVIDSITRQPLPSSLVKIVSNGLLREALPTNEYGIISKKLMVGYYYFVASNDYYLSNDLGTYINRNTKEIIIPLVKKQLIPIDENTPPDLIQAVNKPFKPIDYSKVDTTIVVVDTPPVDEKYPDFPMSKFKPNNIVFVIDISSSMKVEGRLDLLKASMIELTKMLRDIDQLTIITYSNKANILFDTQFVIDKDSIIAVIQNLEAGGVTDGGKGMKMGYEMALKAFVKEGNNQVVMTTDGAFNTGGDNVYSLAQKNAKKDIRMSIVGIKMKEGDKQSMHKIAELGNGDFIEINNFDQTQTVLTNEIRLKSKK